MNITRHRENGTSAEARARAHAFYQGLMTDTFKECRRILRDDGVLTVMFTHKKQEAWEALFTSLIRAGFTITATWPVKTESEHSLHQAKKNAAQSTVILVARKRPAGAGVGYFDSAMQRQIRARARTTAERLQREGLNPVDQLVGSFGPAIEVYSRYDQVRTDTGRPVGVERAIDEASEAVSARRIEQLSARGLEGVEPEGRFALLCWDVLGAARGLARQQRWTPASAVARLMEAQVRAAPEALRYERGAQSAAAQFPEFRAWHALLEPLFGIETPDWTERPPPQGVLFQELDEEEVADGEEGEADDEDEDEGRA